MGFYSLPYILLILIFFIASYFEKHAKNKKSIVKFCSIIFVLFFGFRGYIGTDWFNYNNYYAEATLKSWSTNDYEIGFAFIVKLFNDLGIPYLYFVLLLNIFQVYLWNKFLKDLKLPIALSYAILIAIFPLLIVDLLRNFTSILIAIQGVKFFIRGDAKKSIPYIIISFFFHTTGIFFAILFLLHKKYFIKQSLYIFLFIGLIIYFLQLRFVDNIIIAIGSFAGGRLDYLATSVLSSEEGYGVRFGIIEKLIFVFILISNYDLIVKRQLIPPLIFNLFFVYIFIQLYFSSIDAFVNRFSLLFFWSYLYIIVQSPYLLPNLFKRRALVNLIILLCIAKVYSTFNTEIYQYSNNLISKDNISEREWIRSRHYFK